MANVTLPFCQINLQILQILFGKKVPFLSPDSSWLPPPVAKRTPHTSFMAQRRNGKSKLETYATWTLASDVKHESYQHQIFFITLSMNINSCTFQVFSYPSILYRGRTYTSWNIYLNFMKIYVRSSQIILSIKRIWP